MADIYGYVQKFGRIPDIDAGGGNEEIWDGEGAYTYISAAAAMKISSTDAKDTSAGVGARTVRVIGLDANWQEVSQDVTMNGTTGVAIPTSLIRVYRAYILTVGSEEDNAGDIWVGTGVITDGVPAVKHAGIKAGMGQTLMAVYTIPDGPPTSAKITRWYGTCGAGQAAYATIALQTRESGFGWRTRRTAGIGEGGFFDEQITYGITVSSKCDIRVRCLANGVNNSTIEAGFDLELLT
jgi:hypothetical protein